MGAKALLKSIIPKKIWSQLRLLKNRYQTDSFSPYQVTHQFGGHQFTLSIEDELGKGWYGTDWERLPEVELLSKNKLKPGAKVFDFGAHQSVVAMMLAKEVGPSGSVVAFEGNRHNFNVGQKNKSLNNISNLDIIYSAIAEKRGTITFNESLNGAIDGDGEWGQVEVDCLSIDDVVDEYGAPDVIFMDIEGYESKAILSSEKALNSRCDWFIEVHDRPSMERFGGRYEDVLAPFLNGPYSLYMNDEAGKEFIPFDAASDMVKDRYFLVAIKNS